VKLELLPSVETQILVGQDMGEPIHARLPKGEVVMFTVARDGSDMENEDVVAVIPFGDAAAVLVVADGMGGTRNGGRAAALAVNQLASQVAAHEEATTVRTAILDAIEISNRRILSEVPDGGTTLALVELFEHGIRPFHVGDSTVLVTGQKGKLKLNTIAHSPVGFAVEAGLLHVDDALCHDELHIISNALGFEGMRIELGAPLELARYDTVLIASDGLTDNVFLDEIVERIRCGPLQRGIRDLASLARDRMTGRGAPGPAKPDDLSLIAYRRTC
jgi:serine/threonine protein phosphatase PrpC